MIDTLTIGRQSFVADRINLILDRTVRPPIRDVAGWRLVMQGWHPDVVIARSNSELGNTHNWCSYTGDDVATVLTWVRAHPERFTPCGTMYVNLARVAQVWDGITGPKPENRAWVMITFDDGTRHSCSGDEATAFLAAWRAATAPLPPFVADDDLDRLRKEWGFR
jgi:hypothetical protein